MHQLRARGDDLDRRKGRLDTSFSTNCSEAQDRQQILKHGQRMLKGVSEIVDAQPGTGLAEIKSRVHRETTSLIEVIEKTHDEHKTQSDAALKQS